MPGPGASWRHDPRAFRAWLGPAAQPLAWSLCTGPGALGYRDLVLNAGVPPQERPEPLASLLQQAQEQGDSSRAGVHPGGTGNTLALAVHPQKAYPGPPARVTLISSSKYLRGTRIDLISIQPLI